MSVIWHKVWFDLWQRKARTLLAVMSIAAGVFAIGAIFGMFDQLLSNMDASHVATNPSHINIVMRQPIGKETAEALTNIEGVVGVEVLNLLSGRYKKDAADEWQSATFVMRDDFTQQTYDQLTLLEGDWPAGKNVAIERLSSNVFGIEMGDEIIFELDGTDRAFPVTGEIRHPFVPPPDFGGDTYFVVSEEVMARFGIPQGRYLQILVQVEPYSEDYAKDRATAIRDRLAKQGLGVAVTIYQEPETHWGRPFILGVNLVLQILAVVALLTSVILVINTMTAIITQQTDQIGVIKAIGGTSDLIMRVYLAGVLVYGVLAAVVALPLGMFAAYGASRWLLNVFNIDHETFEFSTRAVVLQILAALVAPLLAALWPVLKGAAISVREAIASYGLGGNFGLTKFDQTIEKISNRLLPSAYATALNNMFRRKGRLALTQAVLITAGTMFLMVMTLSNSLTYTLNSELDRRGYDIRVVMNRPQRVEQVEDFAREMDGVETAEAWYTLTATVMKEGQRMEDTAGLGAELFGVPAGSLMYQPNITRGRWLTPDEVGNVAVISQDTADFNEVAVGDIITIDMGERGEDDWVVIGTYQAIVPEPFATDPIYVPEVALVRASQQANQARQILVKTAEPSAAFTLDRLDALRGMLEERDIGINMFTTRTKEQEREYANNQFGIVANLLFGLAVVMGIVGGIGLMGSLSISVVERTREIGVLRAIGAETPTIMGMFVMEGVLQGLLSWLVAVPLALIIARPLSGALGRVMLETELDFAFDYTAVLIWLVAILFISVSASIMPARNATRISVRESLAYG